MKPYQFLFLRQRFELFYQALPLIILHLLESHQQILLQSLFSLIHIVLSKQNYKINNLINFLITRLWKKLGNFQCILKQFTLSAYNCWIGSIGPEATLRIILVVDNWLFKAFLASPLGTNRKINEEFLIILNEFVTKLENY